jgi:hypothetical protein
MGTLEQFQQKWQPVLHPELRKNKELEHCKKRNALNTVRGFACNHSAQYPTVFCPNVKPSGVF